MSTSSATSATRFHVGLYASNLSRSVHFYRTLFGVEPVRVLDDYARFELDEPAMVLALYPSAREAGGPLNHVGLRLPDSAALVAVQKRLEEQGIRTQRQDGVECCYARQTKFWVTDPDRVLWEVYTLHEDLEHSGFDDPPSATSLAPTAIWEHRITESWPERLPHEDESLDEVRLEGSFNSRLAPEQIGRLLGEARRVLRPGGRLSVHGLVGSRSLPDNPQLPGLASQVERVPVETEPLELVRRAGFVGAYFEKLGDIHCFRLDDVELRELRMVAWKPERSGGGTAQVVYKGPHQEAVDEDGTTYPRGVAVTVPREQAQRLRLGAAADQFAFLSTAATGGCAAGCGSAPVAEAVNATTVPVTEASVRRYREDGYLIVRGLFPRDRIERALREAEAAVLRPELISTRNLRCRWADHVETGECRLDAFDPIIDLAPACGELARDPALLQVLEAVYGEPACLFKDKLIFKPPGAKGYALHQDYIAWPSFPRSFLTVVIPLEPVSEENGCIEVFTGYHRQGSLSAEDGDYHELSLDLMDPQRSVKLVLQPGDVALFSGFTPHRSNPNRSQRWRRQLYLSYNAASDGGEQREAHYQEFREWLKGKYAAFGMTDLHFR
jgi:ectoine hydroxylase-related dioxygenase (phytanoyl-CoA dioxygenase family)/catechol 2,3-dioxygenase-like lactoylglutathione lyase family enzyme